MSYTKAQFANELERQLDQGYNPVTIARWAYQKHLGARAFEEGLEPEILKVVAMEEGPEFEMTEQELRELASRLRT